VGCYHCLKVCEKWINALVNAVFLWITAVNGEIYLTIFRLQYTVFIVDWVDFGIKFWNIEVIESRKKSKSYLRYYRNRLILPTQADWFWRWKKGHKRHFLIDRQHFGSKGSPCLHDTNAGIFPLRLFPTIQALGFHVIPVVERTFAWFAALSKFSQTLVYTSSHIIELLVLTSKRRDIVYKDTVD